MADNYTQPEFVMEIRVLSAENRNKPAFCGLLSRRLTPFISITNSNGDNPRDDSKCDDEKFTFDDKFVVPIKSNFFANMDSSADIGTPPVGSTRHLSYKLLAKDGSMDHETVNLEVKLQSCGCLVVVDSVCQEVIGFPVTMFPPSD
ncbi:hypothetical protein CRYUN_Cryun12cG0042500 [Craigia yunnanensis]